LDRPGIKVFSEASIDSLRNQLGAECLSDLCVLDRRHITPLLDLASDEKECLTELCERLRCELRMSNWSVPLNPPANRSSSRFHQSLQLQQKPPVSSQIPNSTPTPSSASAGGTQLEHPDTTDSETQNPPIPGKTKWPEHEAKHFSGDCQPCAYYFKPDSCKWGASCNFCHLCPDGELKLRKKEKIRALREQAMQEKSLKQASQVVSLSLSSALNCA
jgi:hypothetical protein